ncbi:hypothetical protein JI741_03625 [Chryseolinea sp. Jin1]|uniref:Antitoxin n=2 Tax=Chryseolinea lacunae TaxID=2801331 RepID=A0ABS1KLS5_9BACT|nr:hypothetical protein [Chryseolinea lacunae]
MKEQLKKLEDDKDILILSGPKNRNFVVLTLEQYNAMEETNYLLSTPANTTRLMEAIAQDQRGEYVEMDNPKPAGVRVPKKKVGVVAKKSGEGRVNRKKK